MKRFILFLARITGVENDIRDGERKRIASAMKNAAWWYSSDGDEKAYNAMHLYADSLKRCQIPNISHIRDRVRSLGDNHIDGHDTSKILECEYEK